MCKRCGKFSAFCWMRQTSEEPRQLDLFKLLGQGGLYVKTTKSYESKTKQEIVFSDGVQNSQEEPA